MSDAATFGDSEPEDAWSPGDPPAEQIRNIVARLVLVAVDRDVDQVRLELIIRHLDHIRQRLETGDG